MAKPGPKPRDPTAYFHRSYVVDENGCWIWTGQKSSTGYAILAIRKRDVRASRFSLALATGESGDGLFACHSCDTPLCVNPAHLWWGTQKDNLADASAKGRVHNHFQSGKTHCAQGHEFPPLKPGAKRRKCPICQKLWTAKYQAKNPGVVKEQAARSRAKNREEIKAKALERYWANADKERARMRAHYHATKGK